MMERPEQAYLRTDVETDDCARLLLRLFDRLCLDLKCYLKGAAEGGGVRVHLVRARRILAYLTRNLDVERGEVAANLLSLYLFFLRRLLEAERERSPRPVEEILPLIESMRAAWAGALEKSKGS